MSREVLERWVASGGEWRLVSSYDDRVVVALTTCAGEEMDRLTLPRADLPDQPSRAEGE